MPDRIAVTLWDELRDEEVQRLSKRDDFIRQSNSYGQITAAASSNNLK